MRELRKTVEVLVSIAAGTACFVAELAFELPVRLCTGIVCLLVATYWGWRLSHHFVIRYERADHKLTALFGQRLIELGGAERLRECFKEFLTKSESEPYDRFGRSKLCLSDDISIELGKISRERKNHGLPTS